MNARKFSTALLVITLAACGDVPRATNDAVTACNTKARDLGFSPVGQYEVLPTGGKSYRVVLAITDPKGDNMVTCTYAPESGAVIRSPAG